MNDFLSLKALSTWLEITEDQARRLVEHHGTPRFTLDGSPRFYRPRLVEWLHDQTGELLPPLHKPKSRKKVIDEVLLAPAAPGQSPALTPETLAALSGEAAASPASNMERLRIRDFLLELNAELLPTLSRLSGRLLHPGHHEEDRTSAWRIEGAPGGRITAMSIAWGAGERHAPQFADSPRVEVEVSPGELRVAVYTEGQAGRAIPDAVIDKIREVGAAIELDAGGIPLTAAKVHALPTPAPYFKDIVAALQADLEALVPLWSLAYSGS